jgi:competence protein ComEA
VTCQGVGAPRVEGPARLLFGLAIDPNRADRLTLEALPGLGPTRAAALLAARPFRSLAELQRVPGVGPRTIARLAPSLMLDDQPHDTSARPNTGDLLPPNRR